MRTDLDQAAPTRFVIRPMVLKDLDQVVAIDQLSFSLPWPVQSFRYEVLENDASRQWVAETYSAEAQAQSEGESPRVIGMIVVWLVMDEVHIATIAVHPQYRRHGIGRQILLTALRECAAQGAASAILEVRERNQIAIDMYRKFGFEVVGRRKRYYKDTNEDAVLMTLDIQRLENIASPAG